MDRRTWFLPDYIEDQLPAEAQATEALRSVLLDWFQRHSYLYVGTPLIEHLETLLAGTGEDLADRIFKFTDSLSGRTLGIRADITPQTARIDASLRKQSEVNRLCYCGPVLHSTPAQSWSSRELLQIGTELYGCPDLSADWECIDLACSALRRAGFPDLYIDLGHAGIFAHIMKGADPRLKRRARAALVRRDFALLRGSGIGRKALADLSLLAEISLEDDPAALLARAFRKERPIGRIVEQLRALAGALAGDGLAEIGIDFCALAGYGYHTGMVFDIYSGRTRFVRGGRYDGAHEMYGAGRPAVGFSMDLKRMAKAAPRKRRQAADPIAVPVPSRVDSAWSKAVDKLRRQRKRIRFLHDSERGAAGESSAALVKRGGSWIVVPARKAKSR